MRFAHWRPTRAFAVGVAARLRPVVSDRLEDLCGKLGLLAELESDPGTLGLDTLLVEVGKLTTLPPLPKAGRGGVRREPVRASVVSRAMKTVVEISRIRESARWALWMSWARSAPAAARRVDGTGLGY
jgi:hypothetical protein